jgi:hypothetical protein
VNRVGKSVAIIQSSYIPWKGYFDVIASVDEFILLDDVQFSKGGWRNRNRIKTPDGARWLTIPVAHDRPHAALMIDQVRVSDPDWARRHWDTLRQNYSGCPHFADYAGRIEELYLGCDEVFLSEINRRFILAIVDMLGIVTPISRSTDYVASGSGSERVLNLCLQADAKRYLSGTAARAYLDESQFAAAGVEVTWMDYSGYPEYPQLHPPFEHSVTVLDLIFNTGDEAPRFMKTGAGVA